MEPRGGGPTAALHERAPPLELLTWLVAPPSLPVAAPLVWPSPEHPVVRITLRHLPELPVTPPEEPPRLIVAATPDEATLERVVAFAATHGLAGIAIGAAALFDRVRPHLVRRAPQLVLLEDKRVDRLAHEFAAVVERAANLETLEALARQADRLRADLAPHGAPIPAPPGFNPATDPPKLQDALQRHTRKAVGFGWEPERPPVDLLDRHEDTLRLDAQRAPGPLTRARRLIAHGPTPGPVRFLVVEDHPALLKAIGLVLRRFEALTKVELQVETATTEAEARQKCRTFKPHVALVDIFLEGERTGVDLLRWIRKERLPIQVIGKTGAANQPLIEEMKRLGVFRMWLTRDARDLTDLLERAGELARAAEELVGEGLAGELVTEFVQYTTASLEVARGHQVLHLVDTAHADLQREVHGAVPPEIGQVGVTWWEAKVAFIEYVLKQCGGGLTRLAELTGIGRSTLAGWRKRRAEGRGRRRG